MPDAAAPLLLGIDTGGTFTDAVLMRQPAGGRAHLLAKAKAPTTHDNLAHGIAQALHRVVAESRCDPSDIALVSLSTTLATNALVEGHGAPVALVAIGFEPDDMARAGLAQALGRDPVIYLDGGHRSDGTEAAPLDLQPLTGMSGTIDAIAVAGLFATRNPSHEQAVYAHLTARTGLPVTCSHDLSARLNGPKRALTTLLNARLVPLVGRLLDAVKIVLETASVTAPLMVVTGNGALVSEALARRKPVETILSGPAASLVGASFLTNERDAVVNDMGGTTSDIAVLRNGRPTIDPDGATVGGHRTMVEAVAMRTHGLGGDSAVQPRVEGLSVRLELGPQRWVPVCILARQYGRAVRDALARQCNEPATPRHAGCFAWSTGATGAQGETGTDGERGDTSLSATARRLLARLEATPQPVADLLASPSESAVLDRLVARGLARMAGPTPTDAQHVLGNQQQGDATAAGQALSLLAARRRGDGGPVAPDAQAMARMIVANVERRSAEAVLETAFVADDRDAALVHTPLVQDELSRRAATPSPPEGFANVAISLARPLIGLGAPAKLYHPATAALLGTDARVPDHADVANAIGAVVGHVMQSATVTVTQLQPGQFRVATLEMAWTNEAEALREAAALARDTALKQARDAGTANPAVVVEQDSRHATVDGCDMLVEARVTATASGRPAIA